jgi:hypothetical protein
MQEHQGRMEHQENQENQDPKDTLVKKGVLVKKALRDQGDQKDDPVPLVFLDQKDEWVCQVLQERKVLQEIPVVKGCQVLQDLKARLVHLVYLVNLALKVPQDILAHLDDQANQVNKVLQVLKVPMVALDLLENQENLDTKEK